MANRMQYILHPLIGQEYDFFIKDKIYDNILIA